MLGRIIATVVVRVTSNKCHAVSVTLVHWQSGTTPTHDNDVLH